MPDEPHKFSSTQVELPPEVAKLFLAAAAKIPDNELGEDGREDTPHVTVKYGLHGTDPMPVRKALTGESPAKLVLGKTSIFKNPDFDVLIVEIHSPDLHRLNKKIEKSGEFTDTHPGYKPHATIAYLKPGKGKKYTGSTEFKGVRAVIPAVTFSAKDGTKTDIPLGDNKAMPKKWTVRDRAKQVKMPPPGQLGSGDYGSLPPEAIPHEAITDPPSPGAVEAMAGGGEDLVRGNSNQAPLLPEGHRQVAKTGAGLAALGGVDQIIGSDAQRTRETAQAVQDADPNAPPIATDPALESHALGNLEGEPKTANVKKFLADLIRKHPDYRIPGQGAMSNRPGESFNEFRVRALSAVRGIMQNLAQNPIQAIAVPKHSQVSKLVKAWIAKGMPDDLSVDPKVMTEDSAPKPGEVERFAPDAQGEWTLEKFDPATAGALPKGSIYFIEHGETPAMAAKSGTITAGQKVRGQIVAAIREGDWKAAQKFAQTASANKLLTDAQIDEAIDEAIPGPEEAAQLPPHHLLPMVSAASPGKRAQLMPVLHQTFGEMAGASPAAVQALRSHIGRLG